MRLASPIILGYLPGGFACGVLAVKAGMTPVTVGLMSDFVYAGSEQLITAGLLATGTSTAGIVLTGTEIKSLRLGKASMSDSYCYFLRNELYIRGLNISEYHWGTYNNHQPRRDRKLLLQKNELRKLERASQDSGLTILALRLFIN